MSKIYGYCRVSTRRQSIDRQIRSIKKEYPDAVIVQDKFTGRTMDRPYWDKLMREVKPGDTIVFDEVSRMSRNAEEGYDTYQKLYEKGINLVFLKEPYINTEVYRQNMEKQLSLKKTGDRKTDKLLSGIVDALTEYMRDLSRDQIQAAFAGAQREVDFLSQRTSEGIETARLDGKQIGQPKGAHLVTQKERKYKPEILRLSRSFDGHNTDAEVIKILGIDKNTYYKYKKELKEKEL